MLTIITIAAALLSAIAKLSLDIIFPKVSRRVTNGYRTMVAIKGVDPVMAESTIGSKYCPWRNAR